MLLVDASSRSDDYHNLYDIHIPRNNFTCLINDIDIPHHRILIPIKKSSTCYELVHPDHLSVYDFTDWASANAHPGNAIAKANRRSNPIERFAIDGEVVLQFPQHHPMEHWSNGRSFLIYLGRYGETIPRVDIPDHLRSVATTTEESDDPTMICGSPGESSNNITSTKGFEMATDDTSHMGNHTRNNARRSTFLSIALTSHDQLRQRVAWALSQLFPVSPFAIGVDGSSEPFLNYYDIFVRGAFGNFGEVLEEVSYSPLMGEMLSHVKSKSTSYHYERTNVVVYPDENFAREIMQLFTIGTFMLNEDGTPQLMEDEEGMMRTIPTYDNDNIMTFSRAWTGFDRQFSRGNIEDVGGVNRIDPMMIVPEWRDTFPKMDLYGGYIGDGYPLCEDVLGEAGAKGFLNKGARYVWRRGGADDSSSGRREGFIEVKVTSGLFRQLCGENATIFEDCHVTNPIVVLKTTIPCHAEECTVETLPRGVIIGSKIVFDITPPPCVTLSFYNDGQIVKKGDIVSCANKDKTAMRDYDGVEDKFHWTDEPCDILIKIRDDGKIAMVHHHWDDNDDDNNDDDDYAMHLAFRKNTPHFFQVDWHDNEYPTVQNNQCSSNAGLDCTMTDDNCCLCHLQVVEEPIIDLYMLTMDKADVIFDKNAIESKLHIGSIDPTMFDDIYRSPRIRINDDVSLYFPISYQKHNNLLNDQLIIIDINGHYFKNIQSRVHITSSSSASKKTNPPSFRNPPQFINILNPTVTYVTYETDAVLNHLFHHQNVPPFISRRLIQRVTFLSNPSPRYISTVSRAFRTGSYAVENGDDDEVSFGTGRYGDLAATVAAILLDREVRDGGDLLERDGAGYGGLKEPLVKLVGFMRAMEFEGKQKGWEVELDYVFEKIGQMAHDVPDVFSFFSPDYGPPGRISSSGLVSPEAQVSSIAPNIIGLLNGLFSMIKYGLVVCDDGFGITFHRRCRNEGDIMSALGTLTFTPQGFEDMDTDGSMVVDELATLLTAGRLNEHSRQIMSKAYDDAKDRNAGLRLVQQLFLSTAEFHSTNVAEPSDKMRGDDDGDGQEQVSESTSDISDERKDREYDDETEYKAVILLSLWGGCDSYNMLVPLSDCHDDNQNEKDLYQEYRNVRGQMALSKEVLLPISVTSSSPSQVCDNFGLHPNLSHLKNLYDQNDALFIANAGALTEPVTNKNHRKTQTELFAHNIQTEFAEQLNPFPNASSPTGILGRIDDVLSRKGYRTGSMSLDKRSDALVGRRNHIAYVNPLSPFNPHPSTTTINSLMKQLNNATAASSSGSIFADTWSDAFVRSIHQNQILVDATMASSIKTTFPTTELGQDFELIAKLISSSPKRRTNRDFFHIKLGGFDTHTGQDEKLSAGFETLNDAIGAFVDEMKLMGQWNNVVVIQHSDFGRTLTPNSSEGTDHGWGGNYFMFGGSVRGGRIVGSYPDNLTEDERSKINIGRGRLVPTTSWEAIWNGVARWLGIEEEKDLMEVLPNRLSFKGGLFSDDDLFMSLNPRRNKARRMLFHKHERRRLRSAT